MSFFCFLEVNMGCGANSLSVRMLHLLRKPGHFDKMLPCPHEDEQGQHLSSASIKFLRLRQIHDPSGISPALDNALSTLLSCCSQHFFLVRVLASFIHLPVVTFSDNDSKQITAATSFRMSALLILRTFLVKVKKI